MVIQWGEATLRVTLNIETAAIKSKLAESPHPIESPRSHLHNPGFAFGREEVITDGNQRPRLTRYYAKYGDSWKPLSHAEIHQQ